MPKGRKEGFFESRSIFDIEKIRFKSNDFRMLFVVINKRLPGNTR